MSSFKWDEKTTQAAILLSHGHTHQHAADEIGVSSKTIQRWLLDDNFKAEVDRLSVMVDTASRAHRTRLCMRTVRQKIKADGSIETNKDIFDWLKFAQSETQGLKLDLARLAEMDR